MAAYDFHFSIGFDRREMGGHITFSFIAKLNGR
jgi:hypothetical protein